MPDKTAIPRRIRPAGSRTILDDDDDAIHPLFAGAPPSKPEFRKLRQRLVQKMREAVESDGMVARGARWLVCLSGGKDSYRLLAILHELQGRGLLPVDLLAGNPDQGQPGFPATVLPEFLSRMGVTHRIEYRDTCSVVKDKIALCGAMCSLRLRLCLCLRRGNLCRIAREKGCSAVIRGHLCDDILKTFFLNPFHGRRLARMLPKLLNEDGDLFLYRPLAYLAEADCAAFATAMACPIIPCDLCGSQEGLQRALIKTLLDAWEDQSPGRRNIMFRALMNVRPSQLADPALFNFAGLLCGVR